MGEMLYCGMEEEVYKQKIREIAEIYEKSANYLKEEANKYMMGSLLFVVEDDHKKIQKILDR